MSEFPDWRDGGNVAFQLAEPRATCHINAMAYI